MRQRSALFYHDKPLFAVWFRLHKGCSRRVSSTRTCCCSKPYLPRSMLYRSKPRRERNIAHDSKIDRPSNTASRNTFPSYCSSGSRSTAARPCCKARCRSSYRGPERQRHSRSRRSTSRWGCNRSSYMGLAFRCTSSPFPWHGKLARALRKPRCSRPRLRRACAMPCGVG